MVILRRYLLIGVTIIYMLAMPLWAHTELYKWIDGNGRIHYQDYPPDDQATDGKVEKVQPGNNFTIMGTVPSETRPQKRYINPGDISYESAGKENTVELYVTSWCPYCKLARNFFISKGIPFEEYDIEKDEAAARRKKELDGKRGVPFAVINGDRIHGYSEEAYTRALHK